MEHACRVPYPCAHHSCGSAGLALYGTEGWDRGASRGSFSIAASFSFSFPSLLAWELKVQNFTKFPRPEVGPAHSSSSPF